MAPQDALLKRLCIKSETLARAQALLHTAKARTGTGSGHDLGNGVTGLPAICAHLASLQSELRNEDVSEQVAQKSSCLAPKLFKSTLATVRSVLDDAQLPGSSHKIARNLSYGTLVKRHSIFGGENLQLRLLQWMADVEASLVLSDRVQQRYDPESLLVKCAVFLWMCNRVMIRRDSFDTIIEDNELQTKTFHALLKTLDKTCDALGTRIATEVAEIRRSNTISQPKVYASPSRRAVVPTSNGKRASPTKKRKLDMALDEPADKGDFSPTKRILRSAAHETASSSHGQANTSGDALSPFVSPSQPSVPAVRRRGLKESTLIARIEADVDSRSEPAQVDLRPRRFQPIFLDQKQWFCQDPHLEREWERAEAHKTEMTRLYGHPLESYRNNIMELD